MLLLAISFATATFASAQSTDLQKWLEKPVSENDKKESAQVDKYKLTEQFALTVDNNKYACNGLFYIPNKSDDEIYALLMQWFVRSSFFHKEGIIKYDEKARMLHCKDQLFYPAGFSNAKGLSYQIGFVVSYGEVQFQCFAYKYWSIPVLKVVEKELEDYIPNISEASDKKKELIYDLNSYFNKSMNNLYNDILIFTAKVPLNWNYIRKGYTTEGMTATECYISKGKPKNINYTSTSGKNYEQWVYENGHYLYFENDILVTEQF